MNSLLFRVGLCAVASFGANLLLVEQGMTAFPSHTFDADNQGWTISGAGTDYGPPTTDYATGANWDGRGNPGGALQLGDHAYATWISAPTPFLGNQSDMYGQSFSYDIFIRYSDQTSFPYPSVALRSGTLKLIYTIATPSLFAWQTRVVTFDPALWTVDEGLGSPNPGATATQSQMQSALSNLEALYLLSEWRTGPDDTSIDNIGVGFATGLQGDYNGNGVVDAADYVVYRNSLGSVYTQNDYTIWRANFGRTGDNESSSSFVAANAAVPEPEPAALIACGLLVLLLWPYFGLRRAQSSRETRLGDIFLEPPFWAS